MRRSERAGALREELEHRIRNGRCVYCRAAAAPDRPLTREHVIPRARGGRRKDSRIIVPACARCNHRRGCQEIVLFLLARPRRISAFLEYLATLPPDTVREIDLRVFAELYAAVWLLDDSLACGRAWRDRLRHLCAGRRLHRRRYTARRIVHAVARRLERGPWPVPRMDGPGCPLPEEFPLPGQPARVELARTVAMLAGTLAMLWGAPAARVLEELSRERQRVGGSGAEEPSDALLPWDPAWRAGRGKAGRPVAKGLRAVVGAGRRGAVFQKVPRPRHDASARGSRLGRPHPRARAVKALPWAAEEDALQRGASARGKRSRGRRRER